jgi:Uma2 family endonuclease
MSIHDQSLTEAQKCELPVVSVPRRMSEDEFVSWSFREEINSEWVGGEIIMMSPVSMEHDRIFHWLMHLLREFLALHDLGTVRGPEVQVRFAELRSRREPDIFFASHARRSQARENYFEGPPDMIVEIVSRESESRDWRDKYLEYEAAGVSEYWVIDPMSQHAELYVLSPAKKYERIAEREGWLVSSAIAGFRIKTIWLWPATQPKVADALRELGEQSSGQVPAGQPT